MQFLSLALACVLLVLTSSPGSAATEAVLQQSSGSMQAAEPVVPEPPLQAVSAILYDMDRKRILFEQNADQQIPPASLTKIMTMFLALDAITRDQISLKTLVSVSAQAAGEEGSRMGIHAGEQIRLGELLNGMAVSSGNDASYAVAEFLAPSKEAFLDRMNQKARSLGMSQSHFETPNGLPAPTQLTTARDMLKLADAYLRRYPWALEFFHNQKTLKHGQYVSWNRNPLLGQYPGADGLKTGWVRASGYNLIFTAERAGRRLLGVILGGFSAEARGIEACRLLDAGFLVCSRHEPDVDTALSRLPFELYHLDMRRGAHEAISQYGYVSTGKAWKRPAARRTAQKKVRETRTLQKKQKPGQKTRTVARKKSR